MNRTKLRKGSVLSILMILAMGIGSLVTSFLGRTLVEQSRVSQRAAHLRAYRQAAGQLELAKSLVNGAAYMGGDNQVIAAALASMPPVIAGTGVFVEAAGPARWYRLVSTGEFGGSTSAVSCFMRDGTPYTGYNYYVEEHDLGISGRPRGKIHTNETLEFYFPDGYYDGFVSAVEGFDYKSGADPTNTLIVGGSDPGAGVKDLLDLIDFPALQAQAAVVTPPNLEAVVSLQNTNVKIDLWSKSSIVQVPVTKYKKVQTGSVWSPTTVTTYTKQWQWVNVWKSKKVWIPVNPVSNGTDVAGGGSAAGYWKTVYFQAPIYKLVNVPSGTATVWKWLPVYSTVSYVVMVNQTVPGSLQSSNTYPANGGIFYISDLVKGISGDLNGKATIVTEHDVMITGSIRYKDSSNRFAYKNGLSSSLPYEPDALFSRNHSFGVIAKGDIRYACSAPAIMEINGALISTSGMIGMEGIVLDTSGNPSLSGGSSIKTSLRRFGTIMAAKRPVSTLLDSANMVIHGFTLGSSAYDDQLMTQIPAGFPDEEIALWQPNLKSEGANFVSAGSGTYDANVVTPLGNLTPVAQVRGLVQGLSFDWGACCGS